MPNFRVISFSSLQQCVALRVAEDGYFENAFTEIE